MKTSYDCVVVANGRFPVTELPLLKLREAPAIIACDGAIETLYKQGLEPTAIVGDLDSIPTAMFRLYSDRIHIVEDQEINDLTKAIRFAHAAGYRKILILGATGLREDHTLGNISLLTDYAPLFDHVEMLSDYGLFTPLLQTTTLSSFAGQQVSIFSLSGDTTITTEGLKWPINNRNLTAWWQGSLNEALGDSFTITFTKGGKVIIYQTTAAK